MKPARRKARDAEEGPPRIGGYVLFGKVPKAAPACSRSIISIPKPFGLRFYGFRQALAATSVASNLTRFLNSEKATRKSLRASTTSAAVVLNPLSRWAR